VTAESQSPAYRWAVLGIIMMGTFMSILDTSIVNVALPHMISTFGVNRDEIEWVATGFMLTAAAVMPLIGWVASRVSYKALYLNCLLLFTIASALCAMAWSYESLIAARILQALGGGAIIPLSMSMVAELFEPHERGKALGIWGTGIMVAPALGPTLGGYLTDTFSWRTIFSVNIPFGIITLIAGLIIMKPLYSKGPKKAFDLFGYLFLALALVAGLTALSNGQEKGWHSQYIHVCEAATVIGTVMFVAIELTVKQPILDLKLFLIRNYSMSICLAIFRAIGLFGSVFLFPIFLQNLMGYTPVQAGLWMIPGAVAVGITMPIGGRLADRYSPRILAFIGTLLVVFSLVLFGRLDPLSGWAVLVIPQVIRGIGLALLMAPLMAAALNSVPRHELPMASSFLNVAQNVGGSIGIALLNNFVTNSVHRHAVRLGELLPPQSTEMLRFGRNALQVSVHQAHGVLVTARVKAAFVATQNISFRAEVLGFENGFVFAGLIILCAIPFCLLLKPAAHHLQASNKSKGPMPVRAMAE